MEIITKNSQGVQLKTKTIPAYTKYPQMGSKADNPAYKNMLTQEAMTISEKFDNGQWKKTGAAITTWDDWDDDIWRKQKNYTWDGILDDDGYFQNYTDDDDNFDWATNLPGTSGSEWKFLSEITKYNNFSAPLEVMDINQNYASTKMGYDDSRTIAVGNAGYDELFYSGAEDDDGNGNYGGEVLKGSATDSGDAHTGSNALTIGSNQDGFRVTVTHDGPSDKKFKVSVWAKYDNHTNTKLSVNGGSPMTDNLNERVRAGHWVQMNFYPEIPSGADVYITAQGGSTLVDDFRLHPISSSMTSYVYNEWGELSHILGANNMATYYKYDAMGRLEHTESEVADFSGPSSGGFKKTSEIDYTYKY